MLTTKEVHLSYLSCSDNLGEEACLGVGGAVAGARQTGSCSGHGIQPHTDGRRTLRNWVTRTETHYLRTTGRGKLAL